MLRHPRVKRSDGFKAEESGEQPGKYDASALKGSSVQPCPIRLQARLCPGVHSV